MTTSEISPDRIITQAMLRDLPAPVQRYMAFGGVVGRPPVRTARVQQGGLFRKAADRPWMRITADQRFTTIPPSFVWDAQFSMAGLPFVRVRDSYQDGQGRMHGKMAGLIYGHSLQRTFLVTA